MTLIPFVIRYRYTKIDGGNFNCRIDRQARKMAMRRLLYFYSDTQGWLPIQPHTHFTREVMTPRIQPMTTPSCSLDYCLVVLGTLLDPLAQSQDVLTVQSTARIQPHRHFQTPVGAGQQLGKGAGLAVPGDDDLAELGPLH